MSRTPLHVVWFKRDLRLADHAALSAACATSAPVLPLLIVEPDLWRAAEMSGRQFAFYWECVDALRAELAALTAPLVIRVGGALEVLAALHETHGIAALYSHQETGSGWTYERDRAVAAWCRAQGVPWQQPRQDGVQRGLRQRDNHWAEDWRQLMRAPPHPVPEALAPLPALDAGALPSAADLHLCDDPCAKRLRGGRAAALERLSSFLHTRGQDYRATMASPLSAEAACSRLSVDFAFGTLSVREAYQAARARAGALRGADDADAKAWRASLTSFAARLMWRDHFTQKLETEPALEYEPLHPAFKGLRRFDAARFAAWAEGRTGVPMIDACMRYLDAHGWLTFRMRAMVVSFASHQLWLPWRRTGTFLARRFVDFHPGIHWPQMQMQAGVTGTNTLRIYNPIKQGLELDPQGAFIAANLKELADLPAPCRHEPYRYFLGQAQVTGRYPKPIVDIRDAGLIARDRLERAQQTDDFTAVATAIQRRHGSASSGMSAAQRGVVMRPKRSARGVNAARTTQLSFDGL